MTAAPPTIRDALVELMLAATPFMRRRPTGVSAARPRLRHAVGAAGVALRADARQRQAAPPPRADEIDLADAEAVVQAFNRAGGKWTELVAAVNRNAMDRSRRMT